MYSNQQKKGQEKNKNIKGLDMFASTLNSLYMGEWSSTKAFLK